MLTESTRPAVSLGVSAAWMDGGQDVAVKSRAPLSTVTPWIVSIRILRVQMKLESVCVLRCSAGADVSIAAGCSGRVFFVFVLCVPDAC